MKDTVLVLALILEIASILVLGLMAYTIIKDLRSK